MRDAGLEHEEDVSDHTVHRGGSLHVNDLHMAFPREQPEPVSTVEPNAAYVSIDPHSPKKR